MVGTAVVAGSTAVAWNTAAVAGSIAVGESTVTGTESAGRCRSMQDSAVEHIIKLNCGNIRYITNGYKINSTDLMKM